MSSLLVPIYGVSWWDEAYTLHRKCVNGSRPAVTRATDATRRTTAATSRSPLTRERILAAAMALADERGIEAVSMRGLGRELGVEAMSLYNHVAGKDDLITGLVDLVAGEYPLPAHGTDWKTALRRLYVVAHEVLLGHPWACALMMSSKAVGPATMRYMDTVLGTLRAAGFSVELTHLAFHALDIHLLGYTMQVANFPYERGELESLATEFLQTLPPGHPHLAEHVRHHLDGFTAGDDAEFAFGLDLVLDGIERLRDAGADSITPR